MADSILDKIKLLQPKTFEYKDDGEFAEMKLPAGTHYGFIAQEVEQVFPELVHNNVFKNKIEYKSVAYIELVPILVQAVKEQQEIIEELRKEINRLKAG